MESDNIVSTFGVASRCGRKFEALFYLYSGWWLLRWKQLDINYPFDKKNLIKIFLCLSKEQNVDCDDANSSNNSLRRKLFACQDESTDNDNSFTSLSPVKTSESMVLVYSPPQSGMFVHGTPLKVCGEFIKYV